MLTLLVLAPGPMPGFHTLPAVFSPEWAGAWAAGVAADLGGTLHRSAGGLLVLVPAETGG